MSHEIYAARIARQRQLADGDSSRYQQCRIVVDKVGPAKGLVSLIVTNVGGQRLMESRLGSVVVPTRDEKGRPLPLLDVLGLALERLRSEP